MPNLFVRPPVPGRVLHPVRIIWGRGLNIPWKNTKFADKFFHDMNIENFISDAVRRSVEALYGTLDGEQLQIQKTRKEFEGDYTLVTFPLLRRSRKSPEATATEIGGYMTANVPEIKSFNVIKGFSEPRARRRFLGGAF